MTLLASLTRKLENPSLSRNARAELCCEVARELEDPGDYEGAREALREFWQDASERPNVQGLDPSRAADLLLRAGTLTGWLGNNQSPEAQEHAKNLITESIRIFQSLSDRKKRLEAQTELAYCYWREGGYDEARDILQAVLYDLKHRAESELKAKAVLRSAIVEWSALRYIDSLCILTKAATLFGKIHHHTIKGGYHDALAGVLVNLGVSEQREDYTDRAFVEYAAAAYHFEQIGHTRYRANVENNLGFLYYKVGKYEDAQEHLARARRILLDLKDKCTVAQIDETRARVLIAQGEYVEAERIIRAAVRVLDEGDRQSLLADALTTHGIALARLGHHANSRRILYRAIEVAHNSGATNNAGLAALTLVEELSEHLTDEEAQAVYQQAYHWLAASQHLEHLQRLLKAANQVLSGSQSASTKLEAGETLKETMLNYEREIIRQALRQSNGRVTQAAKLLGTNYQALSGALKNRHRDLLHERTPVQRRKR
jgi:tetratricopeptide (TPR) repeat protein